MLKIEHKKVEVPIKSSNDYIVATIFKTEEQGWTFITSLSHILLFRRYVSNSLLEGSNDLIREVYRLLIHYEKDI